MQKDFPIVGIGASAGGIEALEGFFRGMPSGPGMAFVIVTHLAPDRESLLQEIIARHTALPVAVAADGMTVEIDTVYVLGTDAILNIEHRRLKVHKSDSARRERKPIDVFFSSLAADCGEFAAGVVLSGGDGDGTLGIKAIKERGGLTLAQAANGYGPRHHDMPDSAISTGLIDFAVPADAMGEKLVDFARSLTALDETGTATRSEAPDETLVSARRDIYAIIRHQIGHDFAGYKVKTFLRRVQRRMQIRQIDTIEAYVELLRREPQEVGALFRDLLINVTNFFRDAEAFETLATMVIPALFEGRGAADTVRVWVPGCATGEEVFSIGILLCEHMDRLTARPRVQLFATDIDETALAVARAGRYPAPLLDSVSAERRKRFFIPDGGSYIVAKEVRELCIFSPHSVIRDPPFSRIDLVSCRNLLIYFGLEVQRQVIPTFHYALRAEGFLFLGTSENISQFNDLFVPLDKAQRIFRRRSDGVAGIRLPAVVSGLWPPRAAENYLDRRLAGGGGTLREVVENRVLEQFAPPYVVVNNDGDIVFYSSRTGKYLEAAAGMPTRQILAIARKGLRLALRTAMQEAVESGAPVTKEGIAVESEDGRVQIITLTISPMPARNGRDSLFLLVFEDQGPAVSREEALSRVHAPHDVTAIQLERELRDTRERLQSVIEEYETALEELKSSNEELVSVNEELQSANEELEASKEELQSVNEELHTVNADLNIKVEALDAANSDLQNLFASTEVATLFLDKDKVIRNFTPAMNRIFAILPGDRGRPITDLSTKLALPHLNDDIAAVLDGQEPAQRRVADATGDTHYLMRVGPYRNGDRRLAGAVVTFVDVTGLTRAEAHQRILLAEVQHRTRNLLAVVQSIATQTMGKGGALPDFLDRLAALGRAQNLISEAAGDMVDLADIVCLEIAAHGGGPEGQVSINGPSVLLNTNRVQAMALVLHELATNAVKYGALKPGNGTVAITWTVESPAPDSRVLHLAWTESGVVMPADTSRRGYGRRLIERSLSYTARAATEFHIGEDGISCRITMSLPGGTATGTDR